MSNQDNKQKVVELLQSIETGDSKPISYINPNKYIQHNLAAADGLQGFGEFISRLPPNSARAKVVRAFQDGDYVFTHTDYNLFGPKVGFDIIRFENGLIVEHWDNLQEKPEKPNPSGRTMIDGPTESKDLDKTEDNKKLLRKYLEDVFMNGNFHKLADYLDSTYIQHNPQMRDGVSGLVEAMEAMTKQGITIKFNKIHKILGEGNFVFFAGEGTINGRPTSFFELLRVENGKMVEHWDTVETIPPKEEWKNQNGKFGFSNV